MEKLFFLLLQGSFNSFGEKARAKEGQPRGRDATCSFKLKFERYICQFANLQEK